jgi:hypothetical protein
MNQKLATQPHIKLCKEYKEWKAYLDAGFETTFVNSMVEIRKEMEGDGPSLEEKWNKLSLVAQADGMLI